MAKLLLLSTGVAACFVGLATLGAWSASFLIPICAVLSTSVAMAGHEGSHRSFSASPVRNQAIVYITFTMFGGLSALYWREKHDRLHHGHPNVEGVDPDIKPFPFVSSRGDHEKCKPGERWFHRHLQRWLFWPMSFLLAIGMRRSSIVYLARLKKRTRTWWIDAVCLSMHYIFWIIIPMIVWGPLVGLAVYIGVWGLVGTFLTLIFAPAHIGLPILSEPNHDWLHQVETTRNLELPRFISYFFIGLDYQVEHHIFPKIPHANLPLAAAITKAWCARHGLNYQSVPYLHALVDSARFMSDAWSRDASDPLEVRAGLVGRAA